MPNIEIRGYPDYLAEKWRKKICEVMKKIGKAEDTITSIISLRAQSCSPPPARFKPYLRVCSTDPLEIDEIIRSFQKAGIYEDVEILILGGFISQADMMRAGEMIIK